ncbi:MAG TPA: glycosyltransferase family 2 protein [Blastocatellia bacterium]|nr:glycosyltransferase family 2 protein [Blastocatellia bacterium]
MLLGHEKVMAVELSIIIVNWNGGQLIRRCIESIVKAPPSISWELIVVDNASTDDSIDWLRSPEAKALVGNIKFHLIENSDNMGFGKANNQAFKHTKAPLLLLLNPDTEVQLGAIDKLIATLKGDEQIGACGPRLIYPDGSLQHSVYHNPPAPWEMLLNGLRLYKFIPRSIRGELLLASHWDHGRRRAVSFLVGAAMLIKREVIEQVGGFDERFHMYMEDTEWCLRATRSNWKLIFEPDALVIHHQGQSAKQRWNNLDKVRIGCEAFFLFQRYSLTRRHAIANLFTQCFVIILEIGWRRLSRRPGEDVALSLKLYLNELKRTLSAR